MKQTYNMMAKGNFYFPYLHRDEEFSVLDTLELELDVKDTPVIDEILHGKAGLFFAPLAELIWKALKASGIEQYDKHSFVPVYLRKVGDVYHCSIDVLEKK